MSRVRATGWLLAACLLASPDLATGAVTRDPAAVDVAKRTLDAMGGAAAFARLRTLKFDFVVVRGGEEAGRWRHAWDRGDGRYKVEGKDKAGHALVIVFNVNRRGEGRAWSDGRELAGDDLKAALERGYGRFINDTYWLLMPAKMLDPGVNLASEDPVTEDGRTFDVVRLTFDKVGLTPDDTYWAYVARDTGLMERWDFVLTGQTAADRARFAWTGWEAVGPVRLAMLKSAQDGRLAIRFENVSGSESADDKAYAAP